MRQTLYVWNWVGGGYNQAYATSEANALLEAKRIWSTGVVDMSTFRGLTLEEERAYWKNFPALD